MIFQRISLLLLIVIVSPAYAQRRQSSETFDDAIARIASTFAPRIHGRTVAVFEFPDLENRVTNLSRLVSEQLTTELVQQTIGDARVLERRQVIQVLTELNLQLTDLTSEQVTQVGRQLGADAIVLGSATIVGTRVIVNARVVAVSGGEVLAADRMSVQGAPEILALASAGVGGPRLTPRPAQQESQLQEMPASSALPPQIPNEIRESFRQVVMVADNCSSSGATLRCDFRLTNSGRADVDVTLTHWGYGASYGPTRATDSKGNQFSIESLRIANQEEITEITRTLVPGMEAVVTLTFDTNVEVSNCVALLELHGRAYGDWFVLRFRNIPVR